MAKRKTKPPLPGKPMTVVFNEKGVAAVKKIMAANDDPKATRNSMIGRAVETAAGLLEDEQ